MVRAILVVGLLSSWVVGSKAVAHYAATQQPGPRITPAACTLATKITALPGVAEASGVALSRRTPGLLWTHNDSGEPVLFAFDGAGRPRGRVTVTGAWPRDWEDLSSGPCPDGSCLYLADIGDNNRARRQVTIYRVPEPRPGDTATQPAIAWSVVYPDRARDAEALFVTSPGNLFLISKDGAATALYRVPDSSGGQAGTMVAVAKLPIQRVTGAGASPDGLFVAVRSNRELLIYRTRDLVSGAGAEPQRFELSAIGEPQGEGVAIGADGTIYLAGEGSGSGTLATLRCKLP